MGRFMGRYMHLLSRVCFTKFVESSLTTTFHRGLPKWCFARPGSPQLSRLTRMAQSVGAYVMWNRRIRNNRPLVLASQHIPRHFAGSDIEHTFYAAVYLAKQKGIQTVNLKAAFRSWELLHCYDCDSSITWRKQYYLPNLQFWHALGE